MKTNSFKIFITVLIITFYGRVQSQSQASIASEERLLAQLASFPDPRTSPRGCHRLEPSFICDASDSPLIKDEKGFCYF